MWSRAGFAMVLAAGCGFSVTPAGGTVDAPPIDARDLDAVDSLFDSPWSLAGTVFEAEAYSTTVAVGADVWKELADDVPGFSGTGFMEATEDDGGLCADPSNTTLPPMVIATCPTMSYNLGALPAGTYYVHFRQTSVDSAEDSFWYGFDGVAQPMSINQMEPQTWKWETSVPISIEAGSHTLDIWMREDGARIDVIVVSTSATQP